MRVATIFEYLIGRRRAILDIASDRKALGVAALLVLSAALARNYDQASLKDEPWRLAGAFGASLAISGPLFVMIYGLARWKGMASPGIGRAYLSFLALYWMMAPMAWLYGIPYERFLSLAEATEANLYTLGLVSAWRVALMVRVVSVVFGLRVREALPLVMLVADVAIVTALKLVPVPIFSVMGGISPDQQVIALVALLTALLGWLSLPFWILYVGIVAFSSRTKPEWRATSTPERPASGRAALAFAGLTVMSWVALFPLTQPEQMLARRVERIYRTSGPAAAVAVMSGHNRADFPRAWQPPPRQYPGEPTTTEMLDTLEALAGQPHPVWIDEVYSNRFRHRMLYDEYQWPNELLGEHVIRLADILSRLPRGAEMARSFQDPYRRIDELLNKPEEAVSKDQRAALEILRRLAGPGKEEPVRDADAPGPPEKGAKIERALNSTATRAPGPTQRLAKPLYWSTIHARFPRAEYHHIFPRTNEKRYSTFLRIPCPSSQSTDWRSQHRSTPCQR
jgi:hypothetical protein